MAHPVLYVVDQLAVFPNWDLCFLIPLPVLGLHYCIDLNLL